VKGIGELEEAMRAARGHGRTSVVVIDTDPRQATDAGGHWWDVAVPEVSARPQVEEARAAYETARELQRIGT
jgi:3D-(3,5/4)-trihydroxycyclohexane-1,2-dione acylhydrolase (decyclizing)